MRASHVLVTIRDHEAILISSLRCAATAPIATAIRGAGNGQQDCCGVVLDVLTTDKAYVAERRLEWMDFEAVRRHSHKHPRRIDVEARLVDQLSGQGHVERGGDSERVPVRSDDDAHRHAKGTNRGPQALSSRKYVVAAEVCTLSGHDEEVHDRNVEMDSGYPLSARHRRSRRDVLDDKAFSDRDCEDGVIDLIGGATHSGKSVDRGAGYGDGHGQGRVGDVHRLRRRGGRRSAGDHEHDAYCSSQCETLHCLSSHD
jgi:hypothetical protein